MQQGSYLTLDLGGLQNVNFANEWTNASFPLCLFNRAKWLHNYEGTFNLVLLCTYECDESLYHVTRLIPHWSDFEGFVVQEMSASEIEVVERARKETGLMDRELISHEIDHCRDL